MEFKAPQDPVENKRFRLKMLQKAEESPKLQAYLREKCRRDNQFFCDAFLWTYDPRLADKNPHLPFILWPKQRKLFEQLDYWYKRSQSGERVNAVLDKPRAVGATFTLVAWCFHRWLFEPFEARFGSRKEDYVDKRGESDTIFFKFDYMIERLPTWLLAPFTRSSMLLKNLETGGQISGESANPNFGRGGRKSIIVFDELGFWEWARASWEACGETTNFRLAMSTPPLTGKDSFFYKLISGQEGRVDMFAFDWRDVPTRDDNWFTQAKESKSEEEFAREVLKSYEGTTKGKVYAADMRFVRLSDVDYNPRLPLFVAWDFGLDTVAMIWLQADLVHKKFYIIDSYWNQNKSIDFYVPFITGVVGSGSVDKYQPYELEMILRHRLWSRNITHFGDPNVKQRHVKDKTSTRDLLYEKFNIYIQSKDWGGRKWTDLRDITKLYLRDLEINEKRNEYLLAALRSARYPERTETSQATTEPLKPIHDWTSHFRSALEYFFDNIHDEEAEKSEKEIKRIEAEAYEGESAFSPI